MLKLFLLSLLFISLVHLHLGEDKNMNDNRVKAEPLRDKIGALVIKHSAVAFTSLTWRLVFEWSLSDLKALLEDLKRISTNITKSPNNAERYALMQVQQAIESAESDFNNLQRMITGEVPESDPTQNDLPREKRDLMAKAGQELGTAWTGATGYTLSNWLGLVNVEQMEAIQSLVDTLFRRESKMVTIQKYQITALKDVQGEINNQQKQISSIINATAILYKAMATVNYNATKPAVLMVHSDLLAAVGMFKTSITSYKGLYRTLGQGLLDPDIVPQEILQTAINQIKSKIPPGYRLIFDPEHHGLEAYYRYPLCQLLQGSKGSRNLRGLLQVPLTGLLDDFTLYHSVPFPAHLDDSQERPARRFRLHDYPRYIALSDNRQRFMDLGGTFQPNDCIDSRPLVCPAVAPVITNPLANCLFQLVADPQHDATLPALCQVEEVFSTEPFLQSVDPVTWVLSTTAAVTGYPTCLDDVLEKVPTIKQPPIQLQGDLVLHVPRHCSLALGHQLIPTRLIMTSSLGVRTGRLQVPTINSQALLDLHRSQQSNQMFQKNLNEALKDMLLTQTNLSLHNNATSAEIRKLLEQMLKETDELEKIHPVYVTHIVSGSTVVVVIIAIVILVLWVRRRPAQVEMVAEHSQPNALLMSTLSSGIPSPP